MGFIDFGVVSFIVWRQSVQDRAVQDLVNPINSVCTEKIGEKKIASS